MPHRAYYVVAFRRGDLDTLDRDSSPKRLPPLCPRHQIVENCVCTLRNLSYRLELELPPSRQIGGQELDGLLASESPSKEVDSGCWGRKKKKKRKSSQEDTVSAVLLNRSRCAVRVLFEKGVKKKKGLC